MRRINLKNLGILQPFLAFFSKTFKSSCKIVIFLALLLVNIAIRCFTPLIILGMRIFGPKTSMNHNRGFYITRHRPNKPAYSRKSIGFAAVIILFSNALTYNFSKNDAAESMGLNSMLSAPASSLYLMDKASSHIYDISGFEQKVKHVAQALEVPPEWLMAVMYSESKLNPSAVNHKGSGATGLIQFMVNTVKDLNRKMGTQLYMSDIRNMDAVRQMDLVYTYLQNVRDRYGNYNTITDLYLAVLYPKAVGQDYCYTLYAKPTQKYRMNSGLDENKDGRVTVSDIDHRMSRLYPTAYQTTKE